MHGAKIKILKHDTECLVLFSVILNQMEFAMAAPTRHFRMLTSTIHLHTETLKLSYILNAQKAPQLRMCNCPMVLQPNEGHGLLILELPRLHATTQHSP